MGTNNPSDEQLDLVTDRECPPSNADGSHATPCSGRPHRARAHPTALPFRSTGIISLASSLYPYVALDANSYFDEAGFDDEMSAQLQAKLTEYIQSAEEVLPPPPPPSPPPSPPPPPTPTPPPSPPTLPVRRRMTRGSARRTYHRVRRTPRRARRRLRATRARRGAAMRATRWWVRHATAPPHASAV